METPKLIQTACEALGHYVIVHASGTKFYCTGNDISWRLPDCLPCPDGITVEVLQTLSIEVCNYENEEYRIFVEKPEHIKSVLSLISRAYHYMNPPKIVVDPSFIDQVFGLDS